MKRKRGTKPGVDATAPAVPRRWAWHYRTLLALRERLLAQRGALLQAASEPLEPHSLNEADSATDEFDHDLALGELSAQQDSLYEVDQALQRIRIGTYGVCELTGKPISAARLREVPWTRFGHQVAERLEKKGAIRRPHLGSIGRLTRDDHPFWEETKPEPADEVLWHRPPPGRTLQRRKPARTRASPVRPARRETKSQ